MASLFYPKLYQPVATRDDKEGSNETFFEDGGVSYPSRRRSCHLSISYVAVIILLITNAVLYFELRKRPFASKSSNFGTALIESRFAKLKYDTPLIYTNWSDFQSLDQTTKNSAWKSIDTTPLEVMYSDAEARELGLEIAPKRFLWDETKGVYTVKAVHDIHCLKSIHRAFRNLELTGGPAPAEVVHHFYHCLDALRQDIMCSADDTPMGLTLWPDTVADHQPMMCRNWDQLVSWARSTDRNPCYRRATKPFNDPKIQFLWCNEDSPYYADNKRYMEENGHLHKEELENQGWEISV